MVHLKSKPEYIILSSDFKPLPKHGHLSAIDPEFAKVKDAADAAVAPIWEPSLSMASFKEAWRIAPPAPEDCPVEGVDVLTSLKYCTARDGADIELKVYKSANKDARGDAALGMRFHGGGWTVGGHMTEEPENLMLAALGNAVVVSVDYRMFVLASRKQRAMF
jgi:acetyl esterase/lipase